jgi:proteasome accessory factor B
MTPVAPSSLVVPEQEQHTTARARRGRQGARYRTQRIVHLCRMSYQGKLKRYLLILDRLQRPASFVELKDHLEEQGFELSPRTLQRDLEEIRVELGIEVAYERGANHYTVQKGKEDHAGVLMLLERAQLMELVNTNGKGFRELNRVVRFEELGRLRGIQHLAPLLKAIRERREVVVSYRKFQEEGLKEYRVQPHLLKEYRGRWYLLARSESHTRPIALGVDRIEKLDVQRTKFARTGDAVPDFYDHIIGVDATPGKAERIVLRFDPVEAKYVKSLPLHPTQKVEKEDKGGVTISLFVMPNIELQQALMGWGASVQVLEPKHLAKTIKQAHKAAVGRYKG